jgi:hypothetical protein
MTMFMCVLFIYFYFLLGFIGLNQFIYVNHVLRCFGSITNACMNGLIKRRNAFARMGLEAQNVKSSAFYKVH